MKIKNNRDNLILSSISLDFLPIDQVFHIASLVGFNGIELSLNTKYISKESQLWNVPTLLALINKYNLPIIAVHAPIKFQENKMAKVFNLSKKIDTKLITIHPPKTNDTQYINWFKNNIEDLQSDSHIKIAVENMSNKVIKNYKLQNNISSLQKYKYLTFDTSHAATFNKNIIKYFKLLNDKVMHIHISNKKGEDDHLEIYKDGDINLINFIDFLKVNNFSGSISLELTEQLFKSYNNEVILQILRNNLNFIKKYLF